MQGCTTVPFSELFADTVSAHGIPWAWNHYSKNGMSREEFRFWAKSTWSKVAK